MQVSDILIPILFLAILGYMAWRFSSGKKKAHSVRRRLAELNGWQYETGPEMFKIGDNKEQSNILYRLSGTRTDGKTWSMETRTRMEIDQVGMSEQTVWQMPCGDMTLLLMKRSSVPVPQEMKAAILRKNGLDVNLGELHSLDIDGLVNMPNTYEAFTDDSCKARKLLDQASPYIAYFSGVKAQLSICMTPGNTTVRMPICLDKPRDMESMVRLGLSLCQN